MKIFSTIKQLVTLKPIIMQFVLDKVYYRREHHMHGTFHMQTNQKMEVVSITLEATQTLKISKDSSETTSLGSKVFRKQLSLERLDKYEVEFDFSLDFPRGTKREHKTYKGDMWPLNKATDKAKKQLYVYEMVASVKLKGKKEELTYSEVFKVE